MAICEFIRYKTVSPLYYIAPFRRAPFSSHPKPQPTTHAIHRLYSITCGNWEFKNVQGVATNTNLTLIIVLLGL